MPEPRDPVNVEHRQAKRRRKVRLGYILRKHQGYTLVAMGTSQPPPQGREFVLVEKHRRQGKAMRLTADTYFHGGNMEWFEDAEVETRIRAARCSESMFAKLRALFQAEVKRRPSVAAPTPTPQTIVTRKRPSR